MIIILSKRSIPDSNRCCRDQNAECCHYTKVMLCQVWCFEGVTLPCFGRCIFEIEEDSMHQNLSESDRPPSGGGSGMWIWMSQWSRRDLPEWFVGQLKVDGEARCLNAKSPASGVESRAAWLLVVKRYWGQWTDRALSSGGSGCIPRS